MKALLLILSLLITLVPTTSEEEFVSPVDSIHPVVSNFGKAFHPVLQYERMHNGIDYKVPEGTTVYASSAGKISFRDSKGSLGKVIIIDHGNGIETLYSQLSEFQEDLKEGSEVVKGEVIALSGNTGLSSAPHLHFAVMKNGEFVDPLTYLAK